MKVLYVLVSPASLSESYMRTEREWVEGQGVKTAIYSPRGGYAGPECSYTLPGGYKIYTETLSDAVRSFRPDLVHLHWLTVARTYADEIRALKVPFTARAHSFDFDVWRVRDLVKNDLMQKVWLFPHQLDSCRKANFGTFDKLQELDPACDARFFGRITRQPEEMVFRAGPALVRKGLEEFVQIARVCPDKQFVLALVDYGIFSIGGGLPSNLKILRNLQREDIAEYMARAKVLLRGHDFSFTYGQPIGIAEAMAAGLPIAYRYSSIAAEYVQDAGLPYNDPHEAARLVTKGQWEQAGEKAQARARRFSADEVLPGVLATWKNIAQTA